MKTHAFLISAIALCLGACGEQQQPEAEQAASPQAAAPEVETEAPEPAATAAEVDQGFIDHMHAHAEQLDELMFALADDDLEGALTPAYWLSRHETVGGIPIEWQDYVVGMRKAALTVGAATDLESARAAAEEISANCQACHTAAGVAGPE
jgi:cytochrome c556